LAPDPARQRARTREPRAARRTALSGQGASCSRFRTQGHGPRSFSRRILFLLYFIPFLALPCRLNLHARRSRTPAHPPRLEADTMAHRRPPGRRRPSRHEAHHAPGPHAQARYPSPSLITLEGSVPRFQSRSTAFWTYLIACPAVLMRPLLAGAARLVEFLQSLNGSRISLTGRHHQKHARLRTVLGHAISLDVEFGELQGCLAVAGLHRGPQFRWGPGGRLSPTRNFARMRLSGGWR